MDAKKVKNALKDARENIKKKDFAAALKVCEDILLTDVNNYNALVFVGASAQEVGKNAQAVDAFNRAIEIEPEQVLAYQGLSAYYEKHGSVQDRQNHINIYQKLLQFYQSNSAKRVEITGKLAQLLLNGKQLDECVDLLKGELRLKQDTAEEREIVWKTLVSVLMPQGHLSEGHAQILLEGLGFIKKLGYFTDKHAEKYCTLLYDQGETEKLLEDGVALSHEYPNMLEPAKLLCRVYCESDTDVLEHEVIQELYQRALSLSKYCAWAYLAQGVLLWKKGDLLEARNNLIRGLKAQETCVKGWLILTRLQLTLEDYIGAETSAVRGLKTSKKMKTGGQSEFLAAMMEALIGQRQPQTIQQAEEMVDKVDKEVKESSRFQAMLVKLHLLKKETATAKQILGGLKKMGYDKLQLSLLTAEFLEAEGNNSQLAAFLTKVTEVHPNDAPAWFALGKARWRSDDLQGSLHCFLKAAQLNTSMPGPFLYLGHHYRKQGNIRRATLCYQKAFNLCPGSAEVGSSLSDLYRETGDMEANLKLLKSVTDNSGAGIAKWAWLRLGLHYTQENETTEAVRSLQSALCSDPTDRELWECLADAYLQRGSYTAALKAYSRAEEISPGHIYCLQQIATVKQLLGLYAESIKEYEYALQVSPNYVPALKGLGETLLLQMRAHLNNVLDACAMDNAEYALQVLARLLGDVCSELHDIPAQTLKLQVPAQLAKSPDQSEDERCTLEKKELLMLSSRCYLAAIHCSTSENAACLWQDLAHSYYYQGTPEAARKALEACKEAIRLEPNNHTFWNSLGILAAHLDLNSLAQHAFITSIRCDNNNAIAWTNLGGLYLQNGDARLAHEALKIAQSLEPDYHNSWVGQGLVAEQLAPEEAMDLFRHTTMLSDYSEGGVGYAEWVCSTLMDSKKVNEQHYIYAIDRMYAVPTALDALVRYTARNWDDACSWNLLGMVSERQGLYNLSKAAYKHSLAVLEAAEKGDLVLEGCKDINKAADMVKNNYGRILFRQKEYGEAIGTLHSVKEPDISTNMALALAYFKSDHYEESYSSYESSFHWIAHNDEEKSHILVAMATMAYKFQGVDDVKSLLFQSSQLKTPSVRGLFALCVLGLLTSNLTLTSAALKELQPYRDDPTHLVDVAFLTCCCHILKNEVGRARSILCHAVHRHPSCAELWRVLCLFILRFDNSLSSVAPGCAEKASLKSGDISKNVSLLALCHLLSGNVKQGLASAQKAVHLYPDKVGVWAGLVSAARAAVKKGQTKVPSEWVAQLAARIQDKARGERTMQKWLKKYATAA